MTRTSSTNQQRSAKTSRRQVLCFTGAGVSFLLGRALPAAGHCPEPTERLKRGDKKDVRRGAAGNCPEVVGRAAKWVAEVMLSEFADDAPAEQADDEGADKSDAET